MFTTHYSSKDEEVNRLKKIELQIRDYVKIKDYDNALVLIDQYVWKENESGWGNEEIAKKYEEQRLNMKQSIEKLKQEQKK